MFDRKAPEGNVTEQERLVRAIHASGRRLCVAAAAGGAGAISALAAVPGASRTLIDARVPYSLNALAGFLDRRPDKACSAETAMDLALKALRDAISLVPENSTVLLGVGVSACLATDRPRRGAERCFVSVATQRTQISRFVAFRKGDLSRSEQERACTALILDCIAEGCEIEERAPLKLGPGQAVSTTALPPEYWLKRLEEGFLDWVAWDNAGVFTASRRAPKALIPGSFKPVHRGHLGLAAAASRILGSEVEFEISMRNVDKPPIAASEVLSRVRQFGSGRSGFVTRAPTFVEKARLFPGCTFVIGADTAPRVVEPAYYGDSPAAMRLALREIAGLGCNFLVAGRACPDGAFITLADVPVPPEFARLFWAIPVSDFRIDVSSSELRSSRP